MMSTVIYHASLVVAALAALTLFVSVAIDQLSDRSLGQIGFTCLAFLVGPILTAAPLFAFGGKVPALGLLAPASGTTFWVVYLLEIVVGTLHFVGLLFAHGKRPAIRLSFLVIALLGASWTAKTVEVMVSLYRNPHYPLLVTVLFELLCAAYCIVYFLSPIPLTRILGEAWDDYRWERASRRGQRREEP
jgi:hypothetical protein